MRQEGTDHIGSSNSESTAALPSQIAERKLADYELNLFRNASLADVHFLFHFMDRIVLNRVINDLMHARRVLVVGAGENHSSAMFMSYLGSTEFPDWYPITLCNPNWALLLEETTRADVVFAISTCPSSDQNPFKDHTVQVAMRARELGATVVAIVDQADTVLTSVANHALFAPGHSRVLRSHMVTAILIETIVGVTALRSDI